VCVRFVSVLRLLYRSANMNTYSTYYVECSLSSTMSLANDIYLFFDQFPDISEKLFLMTRDYTGAPFSNLSVAIFLRSFLNGYWGIGS
jgi:hypothetical protein